MYRFKKTGEVPAKCASEIERSRLGIGFEKLDRDVFDPEKAYLPLSRIGVKHVRLQSGWMKTERERGVYDFSWLDSIVDRLIADGMEPWLCLCYGNPLYSEAAKEVFGAVGIPPIHTDEEKAAWAAYCRATAEHFRGRIGYYEIWNEPDGKSSWKYGPDGREYGKFAVATAAAVKAGDPGAKTVCGAVCRANLCFLSEAVAAGMLDAADAFSYHCYTPNDKVMEDTPKAIAALLRRTKPGLPLIQGESGAQSRGGGHGALRTGAWTEDSQCKYMARHLVTDLACGVEFASYFSTMDMIEALNGVNGDVGSYLDYGYFGVLGAGFDENGKAVGEYRPKPSYRTLQVLASVFEGDFETADLPVISRPAASGLVFGHDVGDFSLVSHGFERPCGGAAYVFWYAADMISESFSGTATFIVSGMGEPSDARFVDLVDGSVYTLPESVVEQLPGGYILHNLPLSDRPRMLEFGRFIL